MTRRWLAAYLLTAVLSLAGLQALAWNPDESRASADAAAAITQRQNLLTSEVGQATGASGVESLGRFELSGSFSAITSQPALTQGRFWNVASGAYDRPQTLQFLTLNFAEEGTPAAVQRQINDYQRLINDWQQQLERWRRNIDAETYSRAEEYYRSMAIWLSGNDGEVDVGRNYLFVARMPQTESLAASGETRPVALALASVSVDEKTAELHYLVTNPESLVARASRPADAVGSVGQPLLDYSMRQLSRRPGLNNLVVEAMSERVGQYARSHGFERTCAPR